MSASHLPALDAVALQLVAALEEYEQATAQMLTNWPDLETYRCVSATIEQIRLYCGAIPDVRVQWVELLIAHAELVHSLWRLDHGNRAAAELSLVAVRERHADCISATRARCNRVLARSSRQPGPPASAAR